MPRAKENKILLQTPKPTDWLSGAAKRHFEKIMPPLIKDEVVCFVDVPVIEAACELYAIFQDDRNKFSDRKAALASYISVMSAFGVTYKARKLLAISKEEDAEEDESVGGLFE